MIAPRHISSILDEIALLGGVIAEAERVEQGEFPFFEEFGEFGID